MPTIIPTQDQTLALTRVVREGKLTREQREQTAVVLGLIGSAIRTAAQAQTSGTRVKIAVEVGRATLIL